MNFDIFKQIVESKGLIAKRCNGIHWQILGGSFTVNYYPYSKDGPSYYINRLTKGIKYTTIEQAIKAANVLPSIPGIYKQKRKMMTKIKCHIYKKQKHCYICKKLLTIKEATVDHIIPLDKGGSNGQDNLKLCCKRCNHKKSNNLPLPESDQIEKLMYNTNKIYP